ncbi:putative MFS transporter [Trypanosoma rangeli]|uniref:Putative MFS transporter n=1 Tax=Trypanosoma rangeli TaxID=5698 RepID=A0A3R7LY82_TRYRA|nr:putative MFS transporter [Trypanosoma rangeli]RNE95937.1 putative MFS transporter [Trypanosoma rangeli]|eukprot:RNE95937.1 putative MFS transporter [Trypanosoma rangeli]
MTLARGAHCWVALALFCLFSSSNAIQWITFAPIATPTREFFHLSTEQLNYLSSVYMIVFAGGVILACSTFERWGVRRGLLIGSGLNALGSVLKFAPGLFCPSFTALIVPQTINAFAQLFVLSVPPLIAAHYFPPNRRAFATAVASTSNSLGNAVALMAPPLVVKSGSRRPFMVLFGAEMVCCCLVFLAVCFFLRSPRHPHRGDRSNGNAYRASSARNNAPHVCAAPAAPAEQANQPTRPANVGASRPGWVESEHIRGIIHVAHAWYLLLLSRDFLFLSFAFSVSMGSVWAFASVLTQLLEPFGVSQELAGAMGAINIVVGTVTAYAAGAWVGHSRSYKLLLLLCFLLSVVCCSGLILTMMWAPPNTPLINALFVFLYVAAGVGQNTAIPICFEFSMEIAHPMPDSVPGAILMAGANIVSLVLLSVASALLGDGLATPQGAVNVTAMINVVSVVGGIFALVPAEKLRRHEAELEAQRPTDACEAGCAAGNCAEGEAMRKLRMRGGSRDGSPMTHPAVGREAEPRVNPRQTMGGEVDGIFRSAGDERHTRP